MQKLAPIALASILALSSYASANTLSDQPLPFIKTSQSWGKNPIPATPSQQPNNPTQHTDERFIDHRTYNPSPSIKITSTTLSHPTLNTSSPRPITQPSTLPHSTHQTPAPSRASKNPAPSRASTSHQHIRVSSASTPKPLHASIQPNTTPLSKDPSSHQALCSAVERVWSNTASLLQSNTPNSDSIALKTYLKIIKTCSLDEAKGSAHQITLHLPIPLIEQTLLTESLSSSPTQQAAKYHLQTFLLYHYHSNPLPLDPSNPFSTLNLSPAQAQALSKSASSFNDPVPISILAWSAQNAKAFSTAESLFRQSLKIQPDDPKNREGLVYAILAQNKPLAAEPELSRLDGDSFLLAKSATLQKQAINAYNLHNTSDALSLFQQASKFAPISDPGTLTLYAWTLLKSNQLDTALALFSELHSSNPTSPDIASGFVEALISNKKFDTLQALLSNPPINTTERINNALAEHFNSQGNPALAHHFNPSAHPSSHTPTSITPLLSSLHKTGTPGENQLSMSATSISASAQNPLSSNPANTLEIAASNIKISDGLLSASTQELRLSALTPLSTASNPLHLSTSLGISRIPSQSASVNRPTANIALKQYTSDGFLEATLNHEPDTSSYRSYVGNSAVTVSQSPLNSTPSTGSLFQGQAMKSSLGFNGASQLSIPISNSPYTLTWRSSIGSLSGKNFQSTTLFNGQAQLLKNLQPSPSTKWLAIGPEIRLSTSSSDQNQFSPGFAGAYAPLSESSLGARAYYTLQPSKNLLLKGSSWVGLTKKEFASSSSSNFALETELASAYKLNNHLSLLGALSWKNTAGFNSSAFFLGLNITLDPQPSLSEKHLPNLNQLNFLK